MSAYSFRAARQDGAIVSGAIEADSHAHASATLATRGLYTISLTATAEARRRVARRRDLAILFRSIAALVGAGVPLERAIAASESLTREPLRATLSLARERLRAGAGLAAALSAGAGAIPPVVLAMIRAGERGSQLATALERVATQLEQEADLVARLRQALTYPLLLAVAGVASISVIATVVVPRFADMLAEWGQQLPLATRLLLGTSQLLDRFWIPLAAAAVIAIITATEWLRRPSGRRQLEALLLRTPFVGAVRHALATARVMRALGGMLGAGMSLVPALDAAGEAATDLAVGDRLARVRERVLQGSALGPALEREGAISASALQLVMVGESSGRLGEMALSAGNLAAQEAERGLRVLVTALEPALVIAFGGLVAFTAAALLQAVYSLRPGGF